MLKGLIFDFDGLLVDTETPLFESWREIFDRLNVPIDAAALARLVETAREPPEAYELLERGSGPPIDREVLRAERMSREAHLISEQGLMPGVASLLLAAKSSGIKTAIASNSPLSWIAPQLARLGLASSFDAIRCRDNVSRVKPDPELYLAVLADLGIQRGQAVAFEDSPAGVEAARRAGLVCVAVPNAATAGLAWGNVDLLVPSLDAVTIERLAALVLDSQNERR